MAQVGISQTWLNNLTRYLDQLQQQSVGAATDTVRFFHDAVRERAAHQPGWQHLADEIEVWSEDGKLWVGVRNTQFVSEAWLLEYGDENNPPNSMFRSLTSQVGLTNEHARTSAIARYGTRAI